MTLGSTPLTAGCLLVAAPTLMDPHFMHSVILVCAADAEEGVMGLILNDDSGFTSGDLLGGHPAFEESDYLVGQGGPVGRDQVHFLHNIPEQIQGGREVPEGLFLGGEIEMLGDWMAKNQGLEGHSSSVTLYVGYAGWGAGQLDQELAEGSWLILPGQKSLPFECQGRSREEVWRRVLGAQGDQGRYLSYAPPDPNWN
ncbi:MAG: YqgE/AlgH family protein [Planctomycetes bacterium]|nr:YqgE/AlgH family protein [Planctomycetota bacterium]